LEQDLGDYQQLSDLQIKDLKLISMNRTVHPVGKAGEIKERGYRFDTGPSLLTMPQVIKDLFSECGENINDYLKYKQTRY
jgi:hypothetical protein